MVDQFRTDLRHAIRLFARTPVWTAVAVMSLALGIGANLLIFAIVDAVLLRPFPYRSPSDLVFIWGTKDDAVRRGISGLDLVDWQARNRSFESLDAFLGQMTFSVGDSGESVPGACVGPNVLPLLGVQPARGRNFLASEARPGADSVVIVSDGFWRRRLGGSASALGSTLRLNGLAYELVGIMPAGFFFPEPNTQVLVATPCRATNFFARGGAYAHALGRLRRGVSVSQAEADLDGINAELARIYPETNRNVSAGIQPFRNVVIGKYEKALWLLLGAVGLVLLIACANVAHLQLARAVDRQTELAVRAANGADRLRLFRQLLTETLLLALLSGTCALALAWWGMEVIRSLSLTDIARLDLVSIDLRLAAAAGALSLVSAVAAGVWPSWSASGVRINDVLKLGVNSAPPPARRNLRELLATTELALATVLLIIAGLLIGSFVRLSRAQWGFDSDRLHLVTVVRPPAAAGSREVRTQWTEAAREHLQRIAGVESVASADGVPIRFSWRPTQLAIQNRRVPTSAGTWLISHGYFTTMRTPILEGREFNVTDDGSATPVVVVSRALAARLWPGVSAVGKELQILYWRTANGKLAPDVEERIKRRDYSLATDPNAFESEARLVVGVVENMRPFGLHLIPDPALYLDYRQEHATWVSRGRQTRFVIRTNADAASIAGELKSTLSGPGLSAEVRTIESMSELVARSIGGRGSNRLMMLVATLFGGLALVLTTIGIFGVMLHTVNQRLPEFGVRVALGANRVDIARLVLGYGGRVLLSGLALGLTLTWVASRTLRSLLFGLAPTDLSTWAGAVAIIVAALLFACVFPLRRALRADAAALLRS